MGRPGAVTLTPALVPRAGLEPAPCAFGHLPEFEDGVEELVEALAAHPGRKDERSVHLFQPLTRTPGWVRHPLGVVDDTDERRIESPVVTPA